MGRGYLTDFSVEVIAFLSDLHDCHICKYPQGQMNQVGHRRIFCTKYNLPIKRARYNCIDKFGGFNSEEIREINRQGISGRCELVLNKAAV